MLKRMANIPTPAWAIIAFGWVAVCFLCLGAVLRSDVQVNRQETLTNRHLGTQIDEKSADIIRRQNEQTERSRENGEMLRELLRRTTTRPTR